MGKHRYRITVEPIAAANGAPSPYASPIQFEVANHDDIFVVVDRLQKRGDFAPDTATALGVGLKLFSEVMLENRDHPLFAALQPHFGQFMQGLKKGPGPA